MYSRRAIVATERAPTAATSTERDTDGHFPRSEVENEDTGRGLLMTGRARLPGGEQRKASQKRSRPAMPIAAVAQPTLRPGDRVRWARHTGSVQRLVGDQADIRQDGRDTLWRLPVRELTRVVG